MLVFWDLGLKSFKVPGVQFRLSGLRASFQDLKFSAVALTASGPQDLNPRP